jgi:hypothetical protein
MSTVTDDRLDRLTQEIRELDENMDRRFAEVPTRHELGLKFSSLNYRLTTSDKFLYFISFVVIMIAVGLGETH